MGKSSTAKRKNAITRHSQIQTNKTQGLHAQTTLTDKDTYMRTNWLTNAETRERHADSPSSEIAATRPPVSLSSQDIDVSKNITSHQLGLSRPTLLMNATLKRVTNTNDADYPRRQVHITSIPVSQHTCNVQESTPAGHHGPSHTVQTVVNRRT